MNHSAGTVVKDGDLGWWPASLTKGEQPQVPVRDGHRTRWGQVWQHIPLQSALKRQRTVRSLISLIDLGSSSQGYTLRLGSKQTLKKERKNKQNKVDSSWEMTSKVALWSPHACMCEPNPESEHVCTLKHTHAHKSKISCQHTHIHAHTWDTGFNDITLLPYISQLYFYLQLVMGNIMYVHCPFQKKKKRESFITWYSSLFLAWGSIPLKC